MGRARGSGGDRAVNQLLAALPRGEYRKLLPALEPVPLNLHDVLHDAGQPIPYLYFPAGGLVSLLAPVDGRKVAEVAVAGREAVVGLSLALGKATAPFRAVVHAPGHALRMRAETFRAHQNRRGAALAPLLLRYAGAFLHQVAQSAVCNCHHPVVQRCCRWLLLAQDRIGSDDLPLGQGYLALVLTVRRATISEVAGTLRRAGLIHSRWGRITIRDRKGLEEACCTCYRQIRAHYDDLYNR